MTSLVNLARRLRTRDDGVALPTVFGLALVMLMLVATAMTVTTRGLVKTNDDEDYTAALAAAYAGVEEYQSRLANDSNYQKFGNPAAPFSVTSAATLSLPTGSNANPAFGIGTSGTWANIPGEPLSDGTPQQSLGWFRYEVSNKDYQDKGILHLRVTGRAGNVTRSIVADLKQDGFIDYLYFTNYETTDPGYAANSANGFNNCERYAVAVNGVPARSSSDCGTIQFGDADVFKGPVRSNDQLYICGTEFQKGVMSAVNPTWASACGTAPDFQAGNPAKVDAIGMPPTNSEMKKETRNDLPADVPRPGCLYTGPTIIKYETSGGVTKMRVISPWTRYTNVTGATNASASNAAGASNPAACGIPGTADGQLGGKDGALIDPLERNLAYVQAVPAYGAADPNAPTSATAMPSSRFACTAATTYQVPATGSNRVTVSVPAGWTFTGGTTTYRFPKGNSSTTYESVPYTGTYVAASYKHYDCRAGDVYIEGQMSGQMTVAADNFVYVTGDLTYNDKSTDVLGLVGNNAVFVYNPVRITGFSGSGTANWPGGSRSPNAYTNINSVDDREIDAAILSVSHTFQVQNYTYGSRGNLIIYGALAQKFRGTVGTAAGMGFTKLYEYDTRFRNIAPPKFLTPTSTTYGVTQVATVLPAFKADGTTN